MQNNKEKALDRFLKKNAKKPNFKETVLNERDGLMIERFDKILVTKDGKQLLREQY